MDQNKIVDVINNVVDEARNRLGPYSYVIDEARTLLEDAVKTDKNDVQLENYVEADVMIQLSSNQQALRNMGVKRTAVAQCQNHDVTPLWPGMAKNVITNNADMKRFVHAYVLSTYGTQPDVLSLSINSMYKDIISTSYLDRAQGLRILTQLVIENIALVDAVTVFSACSKGLTDTSPYVRKVAVEAAADLILHEFAQLNPGDCSMSLSGLITALRDNESYICGAAARGLSRVMAAVERDEALAIYKKEFVSGMNPLYRVLLSSKIDSMPPLDASCAIDLLTFYARLTFKNPHRISDDVPTDLKCFFDFIETIKYKQSSCLITSGILALINLNAPATYLVSMLPHLFRILSAGEPTTNYSGNKVLLLECLLPVLNQLCSVDECIEIVRENVRSLLPTSTDTYNIRCSKVTILRTIIEDKNKDIVIHSILQSVHWKEPILLKKAGFQGLYDIAMDHKDYVQPVIACFTMLLHSYDRSLVSLVSQTLCSLLGAVENTHNVDVIRRLCSYFLAASSDRVSKEAKVDFICLISGIMGLYPYDAPKCVLDAAKTFKREDAKVQMQMMAYAMEVLHHFIAAKEHKGLVPYIEDEMDPEIVEVVTERIRNICKYMALECLTSQDMGSLSEMVKGMAKYVMYVVSSDCTAKLPAEALETTNKEKIRNLNSKYENNTSTGFQTRLPSFASVDTDPSLRKTYIPPTTVNKSQVESSLSTTRQVLGIGGKMNTIPDFSFHGNLDDFLATMPKEQVSRPPTTNAVRNAMIVKQIEESTEVDHGDGSDMSEDDTIKPIKITK